MINIFDRRKKDWTLLSVYTDETRTKTKHIITWKGKKYDLIQDYNTHNIYFTDNNGQKWILKI